VPFNWTRYEFDLSDWADAADGYLFVTINEISPWITLTGLFIDDLEIWDSTSSVESEIPGLVSGPVAYPNPFNPRTTIAFDSNSSSRIDLSIHDEGIIRSGSAMALPLP